MKIARFFGKETTTYKLTFEVINLGNKISADSVLTGKAVFLITQCLMYESFGAHAITLRRNFVHNRDRMNYDANSRRN